MVPESDKKNAHVVIVDDERNIAELLAEYLGTMFDVIAFSDPGKALFYLQNHQADLLVTDFAMPGMDGFELIAQARLLNPALKTVLLSGHAKAIEEANRPSASRLYDVFLRKPASLITIGRRCMQVLES